MKDKLMRYIRYLYMLDNYFKFDKQTDKTGTIEFFWFDAYSIDNEKTFTSKRIDYEIFCMLYNLSLINLSLGLTQL